MLQPSVSRNISDSEHMDPGSNRNPTVGYVVNAWPRLSQTFILNEILALEAGGRRLRIFSLKDPGGEPVHAEVANVRAKVTYVSLAPPW